MIPQRFKTMIPPKKKTNTEVDKDNLKTILVCGIWFNVFMFSPGDNNAFWPTIVALVLATVIAGLSACALDYLTGDPWF